MCMHTQAEKEVIRLLSDLVEKEVIRLLSDLKTLLLIPTQLSMQSEI